MLKDLRLFKLIDESNSWPRPLGAPNAEQYLTLIKLAADAFRPRLEEYESVFGDLVTEVADAVDMADEYPFNPLGHFVEHQSNMRVILERIPPQLRTHQPSPSQGSGDHSTSSYAGPQSS
jgi:hypothetical protein